MLKIPFTRKSLIDWAGDQVVRDAEQIVERGYVLEAEFKAPHMAGTILHNNTELHTSLEMLRDGSVSNHCPCYANRERGLICRHAIAVALVLVHRATDPQRNAKYEAERRRAQRLAEVDEAIYLKRVPMETPGALPARLVLGLDRNWQEQHQLGRVGLSVAIEYRGKARPPDEVPRDQPLAFTKRDESLLFVLEDIAAGPVPARVELGAIDLVNLIGLYSGGALPCNAHTITVNQSPMTTLLRVDINQQTGQLELRAHTELPFLKPGDAPFYVVAGKTGWVHGAGHLWPLQNVLPEPYHGIYRAPVVVGRADVLRFLKHEAPLLANSARIESEIALDLFTIDPASPRFRLLVRGSPVSLAAVLYADYGVVELVADKPDARSDFAIPDPDDLLRYLVRNTPAERLALDRLRATGFVGESGDTLASIVGKRQVLNFLGGWLPELRRHGWKVDLEGSVAETLEGNHFVTPVVSVRDATDGSWFDVGYNFEDQEGRSLSLADVQLAMRKGEAFLERNGRTYLIDTHAVDDMLGVFADCSSRDGAEPGHFRMAGIYSAFVKSSLDALDGVDVDDTPGWRQRATQANRFTALQPVDLREPLASTLRPYQKDGVNWLRYLEANGFCGLLADEMGLGKTLQTLAWLQLQRTEAGAQGQPALIVCPTSLVENWAEEARRFAPDLRVLCLTGPDRHEKWDRIASHDVVVTSYALLRRDLERYLGMEFAVSVLDEAQHIKNRSTRNAVSAKSLRARNRLVLTGTPVENGVSDIWSIMDFLMPGYLGDHENFKAHYEAPIVRGGTAAEVAQAKLRRKLQPFLLRRLKTDVAKDLPPKIEKTSFCALSADQKLVYAEILNAARQKIGALVSKQGFNKCRMEILATLVRLRQACCHLDLLKLPGLKAEFPSAKLDMFWELLDEALDSGHRILVFSQFVSMLRILETELQKYGLEYCYLDGSTKERLQEVHRFNTQRQIPVFLISLKAGGTGLNLTGADMVIHFDPWWNPAVENQATDRAYRIGQKRTVYSVKLITRGTVEEKVLELQQRKKAIIDATVESDEHAMQALSWEDVKELLEL